MRLLQDFDERNYSSKDRIFTRRAARAIIIKNGRIALVQSEKEGFYKFPGGGIENEETEIDALCRETLEEAGLIIIRESVRPFGYIREKRKSIYKKNEIFEMYSYYYTADVEDEACEQKLDGYEAELGYKLEFVELKKAYDVNMKLGRYRKSRFLTREARVLELLMKETESNNE